MGDVKYRFACDENDTILDITKIDSNYRKEHSFRCIGCGQRMKANFCKNKANYFSHNGDSCSSETYLHKLAKRIIKERFNKSDSFEIAYRQTEVCDRFQSCCFFEKEICSNIVLKKFNLKDYYTLCEEEKHVKGFIADLLLSNTIRKEDDSILIEICVTHPCTDEKINSGLRIIEISVDSEETIRKLKYSDISEINNSIRFHGFKREVKNKVPINKRIIQKISLYPNERIDKIPFGCYCNYMQIENNNNNSIAEIYVPNFKEFSYAHALVVLRENGMELKNCILCEYYKRYDNHSLIHSNCMNWRRADKCSNYKENRRMIEKLLSELTGKYILIK